MKPLEIVFLLIAIFIATLIIFLLQPMLLDPGSEIFGGRFVGDTESINKLRSGLMYPSLMLNFMLGIAATLLWIARGATFQSVNSREALSKERTWWIMCISCGLVNLIVVIALSFSNQLSDERDFNQFMFLLCIFSIINVILMYWLPTAIATPRTMRYIPPGSQVLRSYFGV
jgi:hypothetical protein